MLVLSRRVDEKLFFPGINASIVVVETKPGQVRLGIEAPASVVCVREEVPVKPEQWNVFLKAKELAHKLGNKINTTSLGLGLLKKQIEAGKPTEDIMKTIERMVRGLEITEEVPNAPARKKLHALLVEDDENQRELLAGLLRLQSFDVEMAENGSEAMYRLGLGIKPDVVLLDVGLGEGQMDGCDIARNIRNDHALDRTKIVMVTGTDAPARVPKVDRWLKKPVQPERLIREIEQLCSAAA